MLPEYTLASSGDKCSGGKQAKDRLTILFCAKSDGSDKINPLVIGKFKNPRCFKGINQLPVHYTNTSNAWMTTAIFNDWLTKLNAKMERNKKKIILFLDNFSGHASKVNLSNIRIEFYPANCTSVLQPLDQGIIRSFKSYYRQKVLRHVISHMDRVEVSEPLNVLDALHFISSSWRDVKQTTIQNCFVLAGCKSIITFPILEHSETNSLIEKYCSIKQIASVPFDQFVSFDDNLENSNVATEEQIVENLRVHLQDKDDVDDKVEEAMPVKEAIDLKTALHYCDEIKYLFLTKSFSLFSVNELEDILISERINSIKQDTIENYFRKTQV